MDKQKYEALKASIALENEGNKEYEETKRFVERGWNALSKGYQQIFGNVVIAGHGEDEVAAIVGTDDITIERVVRESYQILADRGYSREEAHRFMDLMQAYWL